MMISILVRSSASRRLGWDCHMLARRRRGSTADAAARGVVSSARRTRYDVGAPPATRSNSRKRRQCLRRVVRCARHCDEDLSQDPRFPRSPDTVALLAPGPMVHGGPSMVDDHKRLMALCCANAGDRDCSPVLTGPVGMGRGSIVRWRAWDGWLGAVRGVAVAMPTPSRPESANALSRCMCVIQNEALLHTLTCCDVFEREIVCALSDLAKEWKLLQH